MNSWFRRREGALNSKVCVAQASERGPQSLLLGSVVKGKGWRKRFDAGESCQAAWPWKFSHLCWAVEKGGRKYPHHSSSEPEGKQGPRIQSKVRCFRCFTWDMKSSSLGIKPVPTEGRLQGPTQWLLPPVSPVTHAQRHPPSGSPWHCLGDSRHSAGSEDKDSNQTHSLP